jgi:hypothetical protein
MTGLPPSLSIAVWLVGSIWLLAIVAYAFAAPVEIVYAAFTFGMIAGFLEWLFLRRTER